MSRRVLGALVAAAWLLSGTASGQVSLGVARTPGVTVHRPDPPAREDPALQRPDPPSRGHGRSPVPVPGGDLFRAGPDTYAPYNPARRSRVHPYRTFSGYFPTPYIPTPYIPTVPAAVAGPHVSGDLEPDGYLRLEVQPATAQVFLDGLYAGTVRDFSAARARVDAGPHRLEIRAPGYETVTVDILIRPRQATTYARDLRRLETADAVPAPRPAPVVTIARAAPPRAIYLIPRCYAGDRRPSADQLPAGCDITTLRVIAAGAP